MCGASPNPLRIEVKQSELDQTIKDKDNPVSFQLMMF